MTSTNCFSTFFS